MNNGMEPCPHCGQNIAEREIAIYRGLVLALWRVYNFVKERGEGYRFKRKEVKHLFNSESNTARFGDWIYFGGLVFKDEKAAYGLNLERCQQFFMGSYKIPLRVWKNPVTGQIRKNETEFVRIDMIPKLRELLNEEGLYEWRYRTAGTTNQPTLF